MRKYLRAIAQHRMEKAGVRHINRKRRDGTSYFSKNWRRYVGK